MNEIEMIPGTQFPMRLPEKEIDGEGQWRGPFFYDGKGEIKGKVWQGQSGWVAERWDGKDFAEIRARRKSMIDAQFAVEMYWKGKERKGDW